MSEFSEAANTMAKDLIKHSVEFFAEGRNLAALIEARDQIDAAIAKINAEPWSKTNG